MKKTRRGEISNVSLEEYAELSTNDTSDEGDKDLGLN